MAPLGRNFTLDRQVEPLVLDSEISGLEDRHAFLKLGNNVARFHFDYIDLPRSPRSLSPGPSRMTNPFDPATLAPKPDSRAANAKPQPSTGGWGRLECPMPRRSTKNQPRSRRSI